MDGNKLKEYEKISNFKWIGFQKNVREFYSLCHLSVLPSYYSEGDILSFTRGNEFFQTCYYNKPSSM